LRRQERIQRLLLRRTRVEQKQHPVELVGLRPSLGIRTRRRWLCVMRSSRLARRNRLRSSHGNSGRQQSGEQDGGKPCAKPNSLSHSSLTAKFRRAPCNQEPGRAVYGSLNSLNTTWSLAMRPTHLSSGAFGNDCIAAHAMLGRENSHPTLRCAGCATPACNSALAPAIVFAFLRRRLSGVQFNPAFGRR
jgi:hypothetical protein